ILELRLREPLIGLAAKRAGRTRERPPDATNKRAVLVTRAETGVIEEHAVSGLELPTKSAIGTAIHEPDFGACRQNRTAGVLAEALALHHRHPRVHVGEAISH